MPEGPQMILLKEEVDQFTGQLVKRVEGNAKEIAFDKINNKRLTNVKTFGKEILFCFPQVTLRIHLMLFGKYAIDNELNRALRLGLQFETGTINFYACECKLIEVPIDDAYDWSIDVMNPSFDRQKALDKLLSKPKQLICEALLDQNVLAGVGNKLKNDVLFRKQVHPESVVGEIPQKVLQGLINECVNLSFQYLNAKREGSDAELWQVYKRTECPRDHVPIQKQKIGKGNRSCYFCDKCQKLYVQDSLNLD
jgi:endonuclease VIII